VTKTEAKACRNTSCGLKRWRFSGSQCRFTFYLTPFPRHRRAFVKFSMSTEGA